MDPRSSAPLPQRPGDYTAPPTGDALAQAMLRDQESAASTGASPAPPVAEAPKVQIGPDGREYMLVPVPRTWEERVKQAGLTEEQALEILGKVMEQGFYERSFPLFGGRLSVTFRTRGGYDRQRLADARDMLRTNDPRVHGQVEFRMMLSGSLVSLGAKTLPHVSTKDTVALSTAFGDRLAYVDTISDPLLDTLAEKLRQFDAWCYAALWDGAVSAF